MVLTESLAGLGPGCEDQLCYERPQYSADLGYDHSSDFLLGSCGCVFRQSCWLLRAAHGWQMIGRLHSMPHERVPTSAVSVLRPAKRPLKAMTPHDPRRTFSQDICHRDVSYPLFLNRYDDTAHARFLWAADRTNQTRPAGRCRLV
jgi:hypothetical protein